MYSVGFEHHGRYSLGEQFLYGVFVVLRTGPVPDECYEFDASVGYIDLEDFKSNAIENLWENAVGILRLDCIYSEFQGKTFLKLIPNKNVQRSLLGWEKHGDRWERCSNFVKLTKSTQAPPSSNSEIFTPTNQLELTSENVAKSPIVTNGPCDFEFEFEFDEEVTVDGLNYTISSTYNSTLYYLSGEEWIEVSSLNNYNDEYELMFGSPITTTKFKVSSTVSYNTHYFHVRMMKFFTKTEPNIRPLENITHAYIIPRVAPYASIIPTNNSLREKRAALLVDVGDLTEEKTITLLDTMVGDLNPPQFLAGAFAVEELESD